MRLVEYRCESCGKVVEEILSLSEEVPKELTELCECSGKLIKTNNWKANGQVWKNPDTPH